MGTSRVKVTSDMRELERDMAKMQRQNAKLEQQYKELADASRKANATRQQGLKREAEGGRAAVLSLGRQVMALGAVSSAVGMVISGYRDWNQEIKQAAATQRQFHQQLVRDLTEAGDLLRGREIETALRQMPGATQQQALAAFGGITGVAESAPLARRLALTREVSRQAPTGVDLQALGAVAGTLERLAPGKTADDIADMAVATRAMAGEQINMLSGREFRRGVSMLQRTTQMAPEGALAFGLDVITRGMSAEAMQQIAGTLEKTISPITDQQIEQARTDEERQRLLVRREFGQMGPRERFAAIMSRDEVRREMLGAEAGQRIAELDLDNIENTRQRLVRAQQQNEAQQILQRLERFPAGARALIQQQNAVMIERARVMVGNDEDLRERAEEAISAQRVANFPGTGFRDFMASMENMLTRWVQDPANTPPARMLQTAVESQIIDVQQARDIFRDLAMAAQDAELGFRSLGVPEFSEMQTEQSKEMFAIFRQILAEMQAQNERGREAQTAQPSRHIEK